MRKFHSGDLQKWMPEEVEEEDRGGVPFISSNWRLESFNETLSIAVLQCNKTELFRPLLPEIKRCIYKRASSTSSERPSSAIWMNKTREGDEDRRKGIVSFWIHRLWMGDVVARQTVSIVIILSLLKRLHVNRRRKKTTTLSTRGIEVQTGNCSGWRWRSGKKNEYQVSCGYIDHACSGSINRFLWLSFECPSAACFLLWGKVRNGISCKMKSVIAGIVSCSVAY